MLDRGISQEKINVGSNSFPKQNMQLFIYDSLGDSTSQRLDLYQITLVPATLSINQ